ncbi:3-hydroxyacyl-CoA dehydrogenase [Solimonas soli]|uniref:3-hydroxyacyl-CoA dehydrogenase n=1 Tax=Solimonas soli TaxID=413479 RepID=UPI0004BAB743|nr:3-hydroxyacyl-CoA dehydrogenase [Solimonas soli]
MDMNETTTADAEALAYIDRAECRSWTAGSLLAERPSISAVGVIGAGTMGSGIAMNFLNIGLPVTLVDTTKTALDRGVTAIRRNYDSAVKKGRLTDASVAARMQCLRISTQMQDLADSDLIIEAVFETMEVKRAVFTQLDAIAKPGAVLATNTSYLDINEIAAVTRRPESVLGLHFFSPANIMKLVEIVRAERTATAVVDACVELAGAIGKIPVVVGVCYGFVGNRMLAQRRRESERLILEGAMPWDVDRVFTAFGFPMGPFAMADLAGLDLGWSKADSRSATVREVLNEMGRHGQKAGAGYYDYDSDRRRRNSTLVEQLILDFSARHGIARAPISDEEILQRCLFPMINEAARILDEGIASSEEDIDVVWINGYGWPRRRGGPMYYARCLGLDRVVKALQRLESKLGPDFAPSPALLRLAAG